MNIQLNARTCDFYVCAICHLAPNSSNYRNFSNYFSKHLGLIERRTY